MKTMRFAVWAWVGLMVPMLSWAATPSLAERIPETSLTYLRYTPTPEMLLTPTAATLQDQRVIKPLMTAVVTALMGADDPKLSAVLMPVLTTLAASESEMAVVGVEMEGASMKSKVVWTIRPVVGRKAFEKSLQEFSDLIRDRYKGRIQFAKVGDSWLWSVIDATRMPVMSWGFVGEEFVIYIGRDGAEYLAALNNPQAKPLAKSADYRKAIEGVPGKGVVYVSYINAAVARKLLGRLAFEEAGGRVDRFDQQFDAVVRQLGLADVGSVGEWVVIRDGKYVRTTRMSNGGAATGLIGLMTKPTDPAFLGVIPEDVMAAAAFRLDVAELVKWISSAADAVQPGAADMVKQAEKELLEGQTVADLVAPLGDQWAVYVTRQGTLLPMTFVIVGQVKDAAKFEQTERVLERILKQWAGGREERSGKVVYEADGVKISYLRVGSWLPLIEPAWAVADGKLYIALWPELVEDAIAQSKGKRSIRDNAQFAALQKAGETTTGPLVYVNTLQYLDSSYMPLLMLKSLSGQQSGVMGSQFVVSPLPLSRLKRYMGPDLLTVKADAGWTTATTVMTNPATTPLAIASPALVTTVLVAGASLTEEARISARSQSNLQSLASACWRMQSDRDAKVPDDLAGLVTAAGADEGVAKSPYKLPDSDKGYVYVKPPKPGRDETTNRRIIVYDTAEMELSGGSWVLVLSGQVQWVDGETLKKAIESGMLLPESTGGMDR